ncbi:hypothetical protein NMG60_11005134 [Bertholletia excelsa]
MAATSMDSEMSESKIKAVKEALCTQQQLLQKLYNELDVEREASATAASEALSMILRLQGEKAAVKMEASQYKRMAEEKMCHAEEALAIFQDLIYQKEMEIASLECQVQAYKFRLLSLGCSDTSVSETQFAENLLPRSKNVVGDLSSQTSLRRNSMPPIPLKFSCQKKATEKERCVSPDLISKMVEEDINSEPDVEKKSENSSLGDITSYWEQIRKLDERVREMCDWKGVKSSTSSRCGSRSSSLASQVSSGLLLDPMNEAISAKSGQIENPKDLWKDETSDPSRSSNVYDVFEVPQTCGSGKGCGGQRKEESMLVVEGNERLEKSHGEGHSDWEKEILPLLHNKSSLLESNCRAYFDCHLAPVHPTIGFSESCSEAQQLNMASEIIEVERDNTRPETSNRGVEQLVLLKAIKEQLNSIQSEIRSWKTAKSSPSCDLSLLTLSEAMLHFWL